MGMARIYRPCRNATTRSIEIFSFRVEYAFSSDVAEQRSVKCRDHGLVLVRPIQRQSLVMGGPIRVVSHWYARYDAKSRCTRQYGIEWWG